MPSVTTMYKAGDQPVPGYTLVEPLGKGSFGQVWKATSPGDTEVAVKIVTGLDQEGARREFESLRDAKRFNHPNLTKIFAFWVKDENGEVLAEDDLRQMTPPRPVPRPVAPNAMKETMQIAPIDTDIDGTRTAFAPMGDTSTRRRPAQLIIAMGLGDKTLADRLRECREGKAPNEPGGIPPEELLHYMQSAAKALNYLNLEMKVQHCDIKPQNILLVSGEAQVCDFSVVKRVADSLRQTTTGGFSEYYAPPEAFNFEFSNRFDQYSLGVTYAELRTGRLPFESDTRAHVYRAKLTGELDLSWLPPAEQKVIRKATALKPEDRYPSVGHMVAALQEAVLPPTRVAVRTRRRRAWDLAVLLGLIAAVALIAFLLLFRNHDKAHIATVENLLERRSFDNAVSATDVIQSQKTQDELRQRIRAEWLADIERQFEELEKLQDRNEPFRNIASLLTVWPEEASAEKLGRDVLERELADAERILDASRSSQEIASAGAISTRVNEQLRAAGAVSAWDDLRARRSLLSLRIQARSAQPNWSEIRERLEALDPDQLPDDSRESRFAYYTLLAAALVESQPPTAPLLNDNALRAASRQAHQLMGEMRDANPGAEPAPWEAERWRSISDRLFSEIVDRIAEGQMDANLQRDWEEALGSDFRNGVRLAEADAALDEDRIADARAAIESLTAEGTESSAQVARDIRALRIRLELIDSAGNWRSAAEQLVVHAAEMDSFRLLELGAELIERLTAELPTLDNADLLRRLAEAWNQAQASSSGSTSRTLAGQQAALRALAVVVEPLASEYEAFQQYMKSAEIPDNSASPLTQLVAAEVELIDSSVTIARARDIARTTQEIAQTLPDTSPRHLKALGAYVMALANSHDDLLLGQAAPALREVVASDPWLFRHRRAETTRDMLVKAALRDIPTDALFDIEERMDVPPHVAAWVSTAEQIAPGGTPDLMLCQILGRPLWEPLPDNELDRAIELATRFVEQSELQQAAAARQRTNLVRLILIRRLTEKMSGADDSSSIALGRRAVLEAGALLPVFFLGDDDQPPTIAERHLDTLALQYVLNGIARFENREAEFVAGLDTEQETALRKSLASLYGARGWLSERDYRDDTETIKQRVKHFERANYWHPEAPYKVAQGRALLEDKTLETSDKVQQVLTLANQALQLNGQPLGEALALQGKAYHLAGVVPCLPSAEALENFTNARRAFDAALETEERTMWFVYRSAIFVELAHFTSVREEKAKLLQAAIDDATRASQDLGLRMLEEPLNALGNAQEDLAWKVYHRPQDLALSTETYRQAAENFDRAVAIATQNDRPVVKSLLNAGRCRMRWAMRLPDRDAAARTDLLRTAREQLERARSQANIEDSLKAEITWFIGLVLGRMNEAERASEVATYLATPEEAFREAIELSRSANDPRWTIYQMSLADLCVQPGQKAVDFAEYQKRIAPLVEAAATPGDCNPVSTPDFLRMVGYVRQMPRSESLAWINETLTKFGPHANDGLERHRLMLEAYRAHLEFESAVLDGTARTADDWNAMLERTEALLRRIDALPDGPEKELLQFVARSAHGPMLCHSAVAHQGTPEFRRRLIEGTRELADAVAALEDGFSGRMHDGNLDYVTRFLFARYTRILLTSNEPIADREFNERRAKAIDALKPLAARTNLSSAHRSDVERLISGLNSIPPKQARPMSSANRDG